MLSWKKGYDKLSEKIGTHKGMEGMMLLSARDLSEMFQLKKDVAYALMKSVTFPSIRINRRIYVERKKLQEWLDTPTGNSIADNYRDMLLKRRE